MTETYPSPVDKLLTLGETRIHDQRNYLKMGFTHAHIPDLIRLLEDEELYYMEWEDENRAPPQVYAQVHAWRALAQLGAVEAISSLLGLLHCIDEDNDDFVGEEIPVMLGKLGAPAIEPCRAYLANREHDIYARIAASDALSRIGKGHPETRDACVQALMSTLEDYRNDDETVNAFTLSCLADLKAVEAASLAEEIFEAGKAELEVAGDYEDFQIEVGLLKKRLTPSKFRRISDLEISRLMKDLGVAKKERAQKQAKKEKNKRKQAKKARKRSKKK
ncbi:MAG: HEAT repeat domain-containing protein [Chloroflexota bacterium]